MKKTILRVSTAALLLTQMISAGGAGAMAETVEPSVPKVTATATTTAKPTVAIMTDNLFKYGLKKDVELPVTVTAGGLSYTLEKIMIFDFNSQEAKTLRKLYQYPDDGGTITKPKHFIWTKITIQNKSTKIVQCNYKDPTYKWRLFFNAGGLESGEAEKILPIANRFKPNNTQALFDFVLKSGESLTTYQALYYQGEFKYFRITLDYSGIYKGFNVVAKPEGNI